MTTYRTSREIPAPPHRIFAALSNPESLARWWGPDGFTNTFKICEFKPRGRWSYTMHGPNGHDYPNESEFEVTEPARIVIRHISLPQYRLTITLTPSPAGGTTISWEQAFDNAETGRRLEKIVVPANEQNLDRLTAEVLRTAGDQPPPTSPAAP